MGRSLNWLDMSLTIIHHVVISVNITMVLIHASEIYDFFVILIAPQSTVDDCFSLRATGYAVGVNYWLDLFILPLEVFKEWRHWLTTLGIVLVVLN